MFTDARLSAEMVQCVYMDLNISLICCRVAGCQKRRSGGSKSEQSEFLSAGEESSGCGQAT